MERQFALACFSVWASTAAAPFTARLVTLSPIYEVGKMHFIETHQSPLNDAK